MHELQRDIIPKFAWEKGKVYAKCLERKCREIEKSILEDSQSGFAWVTAPLSSI